MNDEAFQKLVNDCQVSERELADLLMVSVPTIQRWKKGKNLPHDKVRSSIRKALKVIKAYA